MPKVIFFFFLEYLSNRSVYSAMDTMPVQRFTYVRLRNGDVCDVCKPLAVTGGWFFTFLRILLCALVVSLAGCPHLGRVATVIVSIYRQFF